VGTFSVLTDAIAARPCVTSFCCWLSPRWGIVNFISLPQQREKRMYVTTTFTIEGHEIVEYRGLVRGIVVRAPTIAQGILGGLKSVVGGNIGAFTQMCEQARQQAFQQMVEHAAQLGANAIVGVRYDASEVRDSATEVLCYGTAVVVRPTERAVSAAVQARPSF
jgi:uncharacterized protein YbjQ (UPF0145 family)